ncbi:MAG: HK97 family phage prohead protease, partial [Nanoarchaeota archaeon]
MPLPKPRTGEKENDFVGRCISFAVNDGMPQEQAVAACFSTWRASKQNSNYMKNIKLVYSVPIEVIESSVREGLEDTEFMIQGIAINSVLTDNNHKFIGEELKSASGSLMGRPLLKDHNDTIDSIVGKVVKVEFDEIEQNIRFQARINNTEAGKKVRELIRIGDLNTVSVGAGVKELEEGDGFFIPRGIKFKELSLVATPADDDAKFTFRGGDFNLALKEAWSSNLLEENKKLIEENIQLKEKNETLKENMHCPECDKMFETKAQLDKHMEDKHPDAMEHKSNSEEISYSYSQKNSDLVTGDNQLNKRQEKQMVETEIKNESTPEQVKETQSEEDVSEKTQKEFEDFKSKISTELEEMKSTQKAQSELLSEVLKGLKDL